MGSVLWEPTAEAVRDANLTRYMLWLERERGIGLSDYHALWEWSVRDLEAFWQSIWDFYGVRASSTYATVLADAKMPGARWFTGAQLNYEEHILARATPARPTLISTGQVRVWGPQKSMRWSSRSRG